MKNVTVKSLICCSFLLLGAGHASSQETSYLEAENIAHAIADLLDQIKAETREFPSGMSKSELAHKWRELDEKYKDELNSLNDRFSNLIRFFKPGQLRFQSMEHYEGQTGAVLFPMIVIAPIASTLGAAASGYLVWKNTDLGSAMKLVEAVGYTIGASIGGGALSGLLSTGIVGILLSSLNTFKTYLWSRKDESLARTASEPTQGDLLNVLILTLEKRGLDKPNEVSRHATAKSYYESVRLSCVTLFGEVK